MCSHDFTRVTPKKIVPPGVGSDSRVSELGMERDLEEHGWDGGKVKDGGARAAARASVGNVLPCR